MILFSAQGEVELLLCLSPSQQPAISAQLQGGRGSQGGSGSQGRHSGEGGRGSQGGHDSHGGRGS